MQKWSFFLHNVGFGLGLLKALETLQNQVKVLAEKLETTVVVCGLLTEVAVEDHLSQSDTVPPKSGVNVAHQRHTDAHAMELAVLLRFFNEVRLIIVANEPVCHVAILLVHAFIVHGFYVKFPRIVTFETSHVLCVAIVQSTDHVLEVLVELGCSIAAENVVLLLSDGIDSLDGWLGLELGHCLHKLSIQGLFLDGCRLAVDNLFFHLSRNFALTKDRFNLVAEFLRGTEL